MSTIYITIKVRYHPQEPTKYHIFRTIVPDKWKKKFIAGDEAYMVQISMISTAPLRNQGLSNYEHNKNEEVKLSTNVADRIVVLSGRIKVWSHHTVTVIIQKVLNRYCTNGLLLLLWDFFLSGIPSCCGFIILLSFESKQM